jgi:hypothetical protein
MIGTHIIFECHNPTLTVCEDEIHIPEMGTWESSRTLEISELITGVKTLCIGVFFISLKSFRSVDVENGLAWAIWTFVAQVMAKRKVGSQIGRLTPNH